MLARMLPLLVLCACASAPPSPLPAQPELARLAQPYARDLRSVGITRVAVQDGGGMVQLDTLSGPVYVRYPPGAPRVAFTLDVEPASLRAFSPDFDSVRDAAALESILPRAVHATATNNTQVWIHANPWN